MNIVVLDFETYFSNDYTLTSLTTEAYIRDPRFETIGVSIKYNGGRALWVPCPHVKRILDKIPWGDVALCAQNCAFDGLILSHHYGHVPKLYMDTMSMAQPWRYADTGVGLAQLAIHYGLGMKGDDTKWAKGKRYADFTPEELARYGSYCKNDTDLTWLLFNRLLPSTPRKELLLIERGIRMFCDPKLELDTALLQAYLVEVREKRDALLASVLKLAPKDVLMSSDKLARLLEGLGCEVPVKLSDKKTATAGKPVYGPAFAKTDKAFIALLDHPNESVAAIVGARLGVKSSIEETRTMRFLDIASRGKMPVALLYCGAGVTQRMSAWDSQNTQNLAAGRDGGNNTLRRSIKAPPGYTLVSVDSSNIELRVCHAIAGQLDTVTQIRSGVDLYCDFAGLIYGRPITKEDEQERFLGKLAHLSLQYGASPPRFMEMCRIKGVRIPIELAEKVVRLWRERYARIPAFWYHCQSLLHSIALGTVLPIDAYGLAYTGLCRITTLPHNQILYPGLHQLVSGEWEYVVRGKPRGIYGAKTVENLCQHIARNIVMGQMLEIANKYRVVLVVHDEVCYLVPDDEVDAALAFGVKAMSTSPDWWPDIPLAAEGTAGKTFS